jgi:hypothetical protein
MNKLGFWFEILPTSTKALTLDPSLVHFNNIIDKCDRRASLSLTLSNDVGLAAFFNPQQIYINHQASFCVCKKIRQTKRPLLKKKGVL